ncbi:hypothetical protein [Halomarina oriensis]|uniref:Uncharacterized protein n=1 Tax=Halomarina oriensis TaxID=671145 RepID=A0A6B0GGT2_9EURY|nr:hypothetical protein [Halomarina oriensis]MWG33964.1 hypothetical protein [Halomarina oriensis]
MSRPPLKLFGPLLALWVALTVAGVAAVAGLPPTAIAVQSVSCLVAVLLASRWRDLASAFAARRLHYVLPVLPIAVGVVLVALDVTGTVALDVAAEGVGPDTWVGLALAVGVSLAVVGGVAFVSADNLYAHRRRSEERERRTWAAPMDEPRRRRTRYWYLVAAVVLSVGGLAGTLFDVPLTPGLLSGGIAIGLMAVTVLDRTTEYTALEGGVVVTGRGTVREQYVPWGRFVGYERTDDALVLQRRLPGGSYHCALDALEDPDAVEAVLRERLG